jgi:hypothetical protein
MPDCVIDLLLVLPPLLRILRGDKRDRLCRAFGAVALQYGSDIMDIDEGRLPANPRDAALSLHRAVLDLCARAGVSRVELTTDYNEHGETGTFANGGAGEAAERVLALLAVFHARQLVSVPQ